MKIGQASDIHKSELLRTVQAAGLRQAGSAGDAEVGKTQAAAKVQLSETSRGLAADSGRSSASVREAKVEEIRKAISEGKFHVNAHAVADKMMSEAAELLETLTRKA
jgi:negative regulator of flagellin synthesis FlgM